MSKVIKNIPFEIDITQLKKDLMIKNQVDVQKLLQMVKEAEGLANPRAMYREVYITEKSEDYLVIDDLQLNSKILRKNIAEVDRVFIYVITVGKEIESWAKKAQGILESFWAEEIQKVILNSAVNYVYEKLDRLIGSEIVSEMNPGSLVDWPIEEQVKVFSLLGDVEGEIGLKLTDSFLMLPAKSISGIKFSTESKVKNCQLCQRDNCHGRRASFDQKLMDEINSSY